MDAKEYVAEAVRTKSDKFYPPTPDDWFGVTMPENSMTIDVLHAVMGIATEGAELLDVAKKAMFYNRPVDYTNLNEEVGDVLWYVAIYCNARNLDMGALMAQNVAKLRARFPACFTEHAANNRDLFEERSVLEAHDKAGKPADAE